MADERGQRKVQAYTTHASKIISSCVEYLLQAFSEQIIDEACGENPQKTGLGEIRIIVDAVGEIDTRRILLQRHDKRYKNLFMSVKTMKEAEQLDTILTTWGMDIDTLKDVIVAVQPEYAEPEWHLGLDNVAKEIGHTLSRATIVKPGVSIHTFLRDAAKHLPLTHEC